MAEQIVVFNNGVVTQEGMSGSDNRSLNWTRIWSETHELTLIIPIAAKKRYADHRSRKIITTKRTCQTNSPVRLLIEYLLRAFQSLRKTKLDLEGPCMIYSSSDLIPDSVPALFLKYRNRKNSGVRLVMGCHLIAPSPFSGYETKRRIPSLQNLYYFLTQRAVLALARRYADRILVSNKIDQKKMADLGISIDRVLVTYGGIEFSEVDQAPDEEKSYDAVFVGRNHPQKGIEDLIRAWKEICLQKPDARLAIVGETETFIEVRQKFAALGLEKNVQFAGFLTGPSKYSLIKASKVLLFPSHYESFGMVALEALACGVPVVAYDLKIYQEIFGDKLIVVPCGNATSLAGAVLENLELYRDLKFTDDLKAFARRFDFRKTAHMVCSST